MAVGLGSDAGHRLGVGGGDGRATVWRRLPETGELVREEVRFRPWLLLDRLDDLRHLGGQLAPEGDAGALVTLSRARRARGAALSGPRRRWEDAGGGGPGRRGARLGRRVGHLRELGKEAVLVLPPEEQYLVATGRTYFRDLAFDQLHRLQFDLETTGLDPERDRIFMIAVRDPSGATEIARGDGRGRCGRGRADSPAGREGAARPIRT